MDSDPTTQSMSVFTCSYNLQVVDSANSFNKETLHRILSTRSTHIGVTHTSHHIHRDCDGASNSTFCPLDTPDLWLILQWDNICTQTHKEPAGNTTISMWAELSLQSPADAQSCRAPPMFPGGTHFAHNFLLLLSFPLPPLAVYWWAK